MQVEQAVIESERTCRIATSLLGEPPTPGWKAFRNVVTLVSPGTELAIYTGTSRALQLPDATWCRYPFYPGYAAVGVALQGETPPVFHRGRHATACWSNPDYVEELPRGMNSEHACFYRLAQVAMTALRVAPVAPGERVLVIGAGMVGNLAAQLCRACGAGEVMLADRSGRRLETAHACGIAQTCHVSGDDLDGAVREAGFAKPDTVIDAVGASATLNAALRLVRDCGRVVMLGSPRQKMEFDPYPDIHAKGTILVGAHERVVPAGVRRQDAKLLLRWIHEQRLVVAPLISHRIGLHALPQVYPAMLRDPDSYLGVLVRCA